MIEILIICVVLIKQTGKRNSSNGAETLTSLSLAQLLCSDEWIEKQATEKEKQSAEDERNLKQWIEQNAKDMREQDEAISQIIKDLQETKKELRDFKIQNDNEMANLEDELRKFDKKVNDFVKNVANSEHARNLSYIKTEKQIDDLQRKVSDLNRKIAELERAIGTLTGENTELQDLLQSQSDFKGLCLVRGIWNRWSELCKFLFGTIIDLRLKINDYCHPWKKRRKSNCRN